MVAYLKAFLASGTLGISASNYPQTVQHFVLSAFPHSFYNFLLILAISFCSLGVFLFFLAIKKEMNSNFSKLSCFLRMNKNKIAMQARLAALPSQVFIWSFISPLIFIALLFFEAKFEISGLGNIIKTAYYLKDFPLLYGSSLCALAFILALNMFFLLLKIILPHK